MIGLGLIKQRVIAALAALAATGVIGPSSALAAGAESPWAVSEQASVRLVSATTGTGGLDTLRIGIEFDLQPGWKTYWRTPGASGLPPQVDWTGSYNIGAAEFLWPAPKRFSLFGLDTFGYAGQIIFPIDIRPETPGEPVRLKARVEYLVCAELCIPGEAELDMVVPADGAAPSQFANMIDSFRAKVPGDGRAAGLTLEHAVLTGTAEAPFLEAAFTSLSPFKAPDLMVEGPDTVIFERPEITIDGAGARTFIRVAATDAAGIGGPLGLDGEALRLTLVDGLQAMEIEFTPPFGVAGPVVSGTPSDAGTSLIVILGLALLGGLILNLMPCVLPVLSIKLLGVVSHGGGERAHVRVSFIATAAGIVASFLVLAAAAVLGKSAGFAVGWGIQFQQPLFLAAMVVILTVFACNMWGLFEFRLPMAAADLALRHSGGTSLGGSFGTGALATLLATPCSAPFLGTAVGFALSRGAAEIFAIFTALGIGLAAPYLLVAVLPGLATRLPRPGRWMIAFKRVLSVGLAASAVWLLSVLAVQVSVTAAVVVGALMVASALILVVRQASTRLARFAPIGVAALAVAALAAPMLLTVDQAARRPLDQRVIAWQAFDPTSIAQHVAAGKTVFVDVTAEWCITCVVNKTLVLENAGIADMLNGPDVVAMQADWTRPSDTISAYLAQFGRYGIPFNAIYGPDTPQGVVLPELLTPSSVMAGFATADARLRLAAE